MRPFAISSFAILVLAASACAERTDGDISASTEDELRRLKPSEIVGTIAPGQTVTIEHSGSPRYRALEIQGNAGETVDLWVRSEDGDAVAILARDTFKNVYRNDDANASTSDAHIVTTLPANGKYFLVVYERDQQPATFEVSLGGNAGTETDEPFPSCDGTPAFPTTGNLLFMHGSKYTFTRSCDAFGVCSPWKQESSSWVTPGNGSNSLTLTPDGGVYVSADVGDSTVSDGYRCQGEDIGSGKVSLETGLGEGTMRSSYHCNVVGGSGGPYGYDDDRDVAIRYGAACLAVADKNPTPSTNYGTQRKSVVILDR